MYWKIKLWAKFVNHFDVFDNLWSRKTQCDRSKHKGLALLNSELSKLSP